MRKEKGIRDRRIREGKADGEREGRWGKVGEGRVGRREGKGVDPTKLGSK